MNSSNMNSYELFILYIKKQLVLRLPIPPSAALAAGRDGVAAWMLRRCTSSTPVSSSFEWNNFVDHSSRSTGAWQHAETLHGLDPGLIIALRVFTRSSFHVRTSWLPVDFTDGSPLLRTCAFIGIFLSLTPPSSTSAAQSLSARRQTS
jgi:hypothetical protein